MEKPRLFGKHPNSRNGMGVFLWVGTQCFSPSSICVAWFGNRDSSLRAVHTGPAVGPFSLTDYTKPINILDVFCYIIIESNGNVKEGQKLPNRSH